MKKSAADTAARIRQRIFGYEDISAYVYLKGMVEGMPRMNHIRHVVVDEAQDYSPVQYGILRQLFPSTRMTLLGDFNQTINPLKKNFDYEQDIGNFAAWKAALSWSSIKSIAQLRI
jgi:DNA helicase IV